MPIKAWEIINALQLSAYFTYAFPLLFKEKKCGADFCVRELLIALFVILLCYGVIVNPSSDIFSFELCTLAQIIVMSIKQYNWKSYYFKALLIGALLYFAYNARTIYLFAGIFIFFECIILIIKDKKWRGVFFVIFVLVGVGIAGIPQMIINYRNKGIISIKVITDGLFELQLLWGLKLQRYDTTISQVLGIPRVCFVDRVGMAIIQRENIGDEITYNQYMGLILKYPFEMIGIYSRHFANLLLPVFPENIIRNLDKGKTLITLLWMMLGGVFGIEIADRRITESTWVNFLPVFIPILFIIPGSVEQRYGMGIYLFVIGAVFLLSDFNWLKKYIKNHLIFIVILFLSFSGLLLSIWTATMSSIEIAYPPQVNIDYPLFFE